MDTPVDGTQNIPALTGLRFFAASAIVLWHSQTGYFFPLNAFGPFLLSGAVPVFFILSGFVLTINAGKYRSWADFVVARIARIWPAHVAAIIFLVAIVAPASADFLVGQANIRRLLLNVFLIQAWSPEPATYLSLNGPSWSISCELFFYLLFPLCVGLFRRVTAWRLSALILFPALGVFTFGKMMPSLDAAWLGYVNPLVNLPTFLLGIAAAHIFRRLPSVAVGFGSATAIQALAVAVALGGNAVVTPIEAAYTLPRAFLIYVHYSGPALCYAALIVTLARYDGAVSRLLSVSVIVYLGEISYSIYLFHQLVLRWHVVNFALFWAVPIWDQYAGILVVTLAMSATCYQFIERPGRGWIYAAWIRLRTMRLQPLMPRSTRAVCSSVFAAVPSVEGDLGTEVTVGTRQQRSDISPNGPLSLASEGEAHD